MIDHLKQGGLVVYPTSTLPGLGCLLTSEGLDKLFEIKKRDYSKPVSIGVANLDQILDIVEVPQIAFDLLNSFPKGSLTIILPAIEKLDQRLGGNMIAIRVFSHLAAIELALKVGPITATSANEAAVDPELTTKAAAKSLNLQHFIAGECAGGLGSTIVKFDSGNLKQGVWSLSVMREGVIPRADVVRWSTSQV
jgi:tRNA threonylcarbamoyl adenosine modification protein (Sua5/YciO/YrdC/YwlC family)